MGWNEPYDIIDEVNDDDKPWKSIKPKDAARMWAETVQPAAEEAELKLVSPTTGRSPTKVEWLAAFLAECRKLDGCDVEKIKAFSVHDYRC